MLVVTELSTRELIETLHVRQILEGESVALALRPDSGGGTRLLEAAVRANLGKDRRAPKPTGRSTAGSTG